MAKVTTPSCPYGDCADDTAYHTFFECERWQPERHELIELVGALEPETIVTKMLTNEHNWRAVDAFVKSILIKKHEETLT